jgi:hypothetical protein
MGTNDRDKRDAGNKRDARDKRDAGDKLDADKREAGDKLDADRRDASRAKPDDGEKNRLRPEPPDEEVREVVQDEFLEAQGRGVGAPGQARKVGVHTNESPAISGGDVDADWKRSDVGEETVGGSVSTPDQDVVDELGEAAGVVYDDDEPLDTEEKLLRRDRKRWELNPASSEDYAERLREEERMVDEDRRHEANP